jgi:two-component system sensor histidine kinase CssS
MRNRPLAVQIWFVFTGIMTIVLCLVIVLIPVLVRPFLVQDTYTRIKEAQALLWDRTGNSLDPGKRFGQKESGVVRHLLYANGSWMAPPFAIASLSPEFLSQAQEQALTQAEPIKEYKSKVGNRTLYYMIRSAQTEGQAFFLLSYAWDTYQREFISSFIRQLFGMALLVLIASFPFSYWLSKYLSRPLVQIEKHVERLAERDWHSPLLLERKDEIGRLAASVERMRRRLVRQDETQRTLLQNISHELKTPIMVIRSYAQAIMDGMYPSGDLPQTVDVIEKEAERLERQVRQLLYLTKLDYLAAEEQVFYPVPLAKIAGETIQRLRWRRPELAWVYDIPSAHILGNEEQLRTALENVLDNQIRYAKRTIFVTGEVQNEEHKSFLLLRLGNDGPPIPTESIQTIFEPYRKGADGQFGLGLAIVQRIVALHHGKIWVKNEENRPFFFIRLPLTKETKNSPSD